MYLAKEFMQFCIIVATNTQICVHTKYIFLEKKTLMQVIKSYFIK